MCTCTHMRTHTHMPHTHTPHVCTCAHATYMLHPRIPHVYVDTHPCTHAHPTHIYMHTGRQTRVHAHTCMHDYTQCTCLQCPTYMCLHTRVHMYMHIHVHTRPHTFMCAHTCTHIRDSQLLLFWAPCPAPAPTLQACSALMAQRELQTRLVAPASTERAGVRKEPRGRCSDERCEAPVSVSHRPVAKWTVTD